MKKNTSPLANRKTQLLLCLFIGLCFLWTGSGYLTWLYHLIEQAPEVNADLHSEVIGYLFQAAGLGLFAILVKLKEKFSCSKISFLLLSCLDLAFICLSSTAKGATLILTLGYLTNLVHGLIAGFYLTLLTKYLPPMQRGLCFGIGYSLGSLGSYLLSIIGKDNFLTSVYVFYVYGGILLLSILILCYLAKTVDSEEEQALAEASPPNETRRTLLYLVFIASFAAFLLSLVKNLGFYFPMADINSGTVSLEFTRLFYALGLVLAGILNDTNRKYGVFACLITLCIPFLLLLMQHQYKSSLIVWIIGYSFTGFFTVYRVLLLGDLIKGRESLLFLAGFGLLFGRIGDALGAFIGMHMKAHISVLICISLVFYITAAVIIIILFEKIYLPDMLLKPMAQLSDFREASDSDPASNTGEAEKENLYFEEFAAKYELSKREKEILKLALTDMTNVNIAGALFISENTTKFHIRNILKKTECSNRNELRELYKKD